MHKCTTLRAITFAAVGALSILSAYGQAETTDTQSAARQTTKTATRSKSAKRDLSNDPKAIDLLKQMEDRYLQIKTVSGQLQQVREDKQFEQRIESSAKFYILKPNKFRADYQAPYLSTSLITDQYWYRYTPELKQVERYKFQNQNNAQDLNYMLLGFGVKTEDLLKVYSIKWLADGVAKGYYGVQLIPIDDKTANFKYVTILITKDDKLLPAQFSMEQKDGVRTTANLDIRTLNMGGKVDEKLFRPNFPKSAKTVEF